MATAEADRLVGQPNLESSKDTAALYKKVLKLRPEDESARDQLSDLAKRMAADTGDATVMCVDALLEAARDGRDEHHRGGPHAGGLGATAARQ